MIAAFVQAVNKTNLLNVISIFIFSVEIFIRYGVGVTYPRSCPSLAYVALQRNDVSRSGASLFVPAFFYEHRS